MSASSQIEAVIEVASELKQHAATMFDAYMQMPAAIEEEHAAIREHDLPRMEAAAAAKGVVSERVEQAFSALHGVAGRLKSVAERVSGMAEPKPVALRDCVASLKNVRTLLRERAESGELAFGVLDHVIVGLDKLVTDFEVKMREVKPLIEANRYAVQALLQNYQDSYRFWQQVAEEEILSYSAKGTREATGRLSGFSTSA